MRFATAFAVLALASTGFPQTTAAPGNGLTTAGEYILAFVQYVRWPAEDDIKAWQVCAASLPVDKAAAYAGRTARGKPFAVRAVSAGDPLADCQILDLTDAPAAGVKVLLARSRPLAILTVGEGESFCTAGGVACLRPRGGPGSFEINLSAVEQARLNVNAQLLMLGRKRQIAGGGT